MHDILCFLPAPDNAKSGCGRRARIAVIQLTERLRVADPDTIGQLSVRTTIVVHATLTEGTVAGVRRIIASVVNFRERLIEHAELRRQS